MKSVIISLFLIAILTSLSCNKFENGRNFSIHSVKKRLAKSWTLEGYVNDTMYNSNQVQIHEYAGWCGCQMELKELESIQLNLGRDGSFTFTVKLKSNEWTMGKYDPKYYSYRGKGRWAIGDDKDRLILQFEPWKKNGSVKSESLFTTSNVEEYQILSLRKNRISLKLLTNGLNYVLSTPSNGISII